MSAVGVAGLLRAGGPKLKGEPPSSVDVFLAWQVTSYLLDSLHGQKRFFRDTLSHDAKSVVAIWLTNCQYNGRSTDCSPVVVPAAHNSAATHPW